MSILIYISSFSQGVVGKWEGILNVQTIQLKLIFNINKTDKGLVSTMDSPDQGAKEIPVTSVDFENNVLKLKIDNANITYEGVLKTKDTIIGNFVQSGQSFSLTLIKKGKNTIEIPRYQEPKKPYPYHSENIFFDNKKDSIRLAGTLTLPSKKGKFPVVILITGSGPQNRDEELFNHKPFLVLSDHLTKNGIAVLRFDDRGIDKSTGTFSTATTMNFATDVESAIQYLKTRKEIKKKKIGLIGHSEGGVIASIVANSSDDVSFIVLLATPGIRGDELMLLQKKKIEEQSGMSESEISKGQEIFSDIYELIINSERSNQKLSDEINNFLTLKYGSQLTANQIKNLSNQLTNPWMYYFLKFDVKTSLMNVKCPVLALNGEKDLQVPAKENLKAIENALIKGNNDKGTIKKLPNLNHLFQECKTGLPNEYAIIEQTFSPIALNEITNWLLKQL
ncbi:MAG: alpha/beta hydrolase [Flavobacteriaceae bacterium]|nr:alpha/beta hydrolase [Flavobacteriaceae bacterium]